MTIGIVDSGIDPNNPEFAGRISAASADVAGSRGVSAESDHGTNVALVAAAARNNTGIVGIAWEATIMALRADAPGTCASAVANDPATGCRFSDSAIAAGVNRAVQNGAKVVNISLGGSSPTSQLRGAITQAAAAGVVVVVSAGNDADEPNPSVDPNNPDPFSVGLRQAGNGNVIIAGSVNAAGTISAFANRAGAEQNWYLAALGERICCVYENGAIKITVQNGQQFVTVISGTSFSAPQISGAVALLRQAFPNLTAVQTVDLLLRTARDAGAPGIDTTYGRGIMDITRAFAPQGTASLASTLAPLPLGDSTGVTSPAMGDAVQNVSLSAIELDSYRRAYRVELGGRLRGAQVNPRLAPALIAPMRNISGGGGDVSLGFAVDGRRLGQSPWSGNLRLTGVDAERARVLAARVAARITPGTNVAFGYAQGAGGLVAQVQGHGEPAFLVAGSLADDFGFSRSSQTAFALRRQLGTWGLTLSGEEGKAIAGAPAFFENSTLERKQRGGITRFGLAFDRRWQGLETSLAASWLGEDRTLLGARMHDAFGQSGADSVFLDANMAWRLAADWRLGAAWRQGFTKAHAGGLVAPGSRLVSSGWSVDLERSGVLPAGDSLALRVTQPLRVNLGGLRLDLPVAYSYDTLAATNAFQLLSLSPHGREVTSELAWRGPLWNGAASASVFYRKDPGHYASLPDDKGIAFSWQHGNFDWSLIPVAQFHMRRLAVRPHRRIVLRHDRADRIGVGGEQVFFVRHGVRQAFRAGDDRLRSFEIGAAVPPDLHQAVIAGIVHFSGYRVLFGLQIVPDIARRVGQRGLEPHLLGQLRVLVLVVVHELLHGHVGALAEEAELLEHRYRSSHPDLPSSCRAASAAQANCGMRRLRARTRCNDPGDQEPMPLAKDVRNSLTLPAFAAPMFLCSGAELASACCQAGIVGSLTRNHCRDDEEMEAQLKTVREALERYADANPGGPSARWR